MDTMNNKEIEDEGMSNKEKFKKKQEKELQEKGLPEDVESKISEPIELQTELFKVKGSLKKNITSDYTLAFLTEAEREFITENYQNAEYGKDIINRYSVKGWRYIWNDEKIDWERDKTGKPIKVPITDKEKRYILTLGNRMFEFFMIKPHMISILGRNKVDNFLVKLIGKSAKDELQEQEQPVGQMDKRGFGQMLRDAMGGSNEYVEE